MNTHQLIQEFISRRNRNPQYSERAFARATGLSPGFLKLLFQGKRRLSRERALEVAGRLCWTVQATAKFVENSNRKQLPREDFSELSDWFHFAILEMLKTTQTPMKCAAIAHRLGLTATEVAYSLEVLKRLGVIEPIPGGGFRVPEEYEAPPISHESVRKYYKQTLKKVIDAVDEQRSEIREMRALTLAFDPDMLVEARVEIKKFISRFERRFSIGQRRKVYQLNLSFVSLEKEKK